MDYQNTLDYAKKLDEQDELKDLRQEFHFPQNEKGQELLYFCGNSLGLSPKKARVYVEEELSAWEKRGVEGHFTGAHPWMPYHEFVTKGLSLVVGAKESEVVAMNSLTVNLHLMLVSFYRPQGKKVKILCEKGAFPSDQYALKSQLAFHGHPASALLEVDSSEILAVMEKEKDELALVCLGGVNYLSGEVFNMKEIGAHARRLGIVFGLDLAHAAGNLALKLHDWQVDFAVWCSYKYLNSGPGAIAGAFVHEKHHQEKLPRFAGWWGQNKKTRFLMGPDFDPIPSVESWQLSNPPILQLAALRASLEIFERAGMPQVRAKSEKLTGHLAWLLSQSKKKIEILTPAAPDRRGAQLSLKLARPGKNFLQELAQKKVLADFREPNILRVAPTALYNRFEDVYHLAHILEGAL